jgi:hypothetical protein
MTQTTDTLDKPDAEVDDGTTGPNKEFHYVRKDAIVRTVVEGGLVTALCGLSFPVTKAAKPGSPVCSMCKQLYEMMPEDSQ